MTWLSIGSIPIPALQLGFAGAIPFAVLAILTFIFGWAGDYLIYYGVAILSFMGGILWGAAMEDEATMPRLAASVVPALVGWLAAIVGGWLGLTILAVGFVCLLAYDLYAARKNFVPSWYPSLRIPLTAIVVVCLLLATLQES